MTVSFGLFSVTLIIVALVISQSYAIRSGGKCPARTTSTVPSFSLDQIVGTWYVAASSGKVATCSKFEFQAGNKFVYTYYRKGQQKTVSGNVADKDTSGLYALRYNTTVGGLPVPVSLDFSVITYQQNDYLVIYTCDNLLGGLYHQYHWVVLSASQQITAEKLQAVLDIMERDGIPNPKAIIYVGNQNICYASDSDLTSDDNIGFRIQEEAY
ncbi:hypothetical protein ABK040_012328 [Willaertia magna]